MHPPRKTAVERTVRHKPYAELSAGIEHSVHLHVAMHQMIFTLDGCQRAYCMSLAYCVGTHLA